MDMFCFDIQYIVLFLEKENAESQFKKQDKTKKNKGRNNYFSALFIEKKMQYGRKCCILVLILSFLICNELSLGFEG